MATFLSRIFRNLQFPYRNVMARHHRAPTPRAKGGLSDFGQNGANLAEMLHFCQIWFKMDHFLVRLVSKWVQIAKKRSDLGQGWSNPIQKWSKTLSREKHFFLRGKADLLCSFFLIKGYRTTAAPIQSLAWDSCVQFHFPHF